MTRIIMSSPEAKIIFVIFSKGREKPSSLTHWLKGLWKYNLKSFNP